MVAIGDHITIQPMYLVGRNEFVTTSDNTIYKRTFRGTVTQICEKYFLVQGGELAAVLFVDGRAGRADQGAPGRRHDANGEAQPGKNAARTEEAHPGAGGGNEGEGQGKEEAGMSRLTPYEQETHITYNNEEKTATVYTYHKALVTQLEKRGMVGEKDGFGGKTFTKAGLR